MTRSSSERQDEVKVHERRNYEGKKGDEEAVVEERCICTNWAYHQETQTENSHEGQSSAWVNEHVANGFLGCRNGTYFVSGTLARITRGIGRHNITASGVMLKNASRIIWCR